jgi:hypothetical protein
MIDLVIRFPRLRNKPCSSARELYFGLAEATIQLHFALHLRFRRQQPAVKLAEYALRFSPGKARAARSAACQFREIGAAVCTELG